MFSFSHLTNALVVNTKSSLSTRPALYIYIYVRPLQMLLWVLVSTLSPIRCGQVGSIKRTAFPCVVRSFPDLRSSPGEISLPIGKHICPRYGSLTGRVRCYKTIPYRLMLPLCTARHSLVPRVPALYGKSEKVPYI